MPIGQGQGVPQTARTAVWPVRGLRDHSDADIDSDGGLAAGNKLAVGEASPTAVSVRVNMGKVFAQGYQFGGGVSMPNRVLHTFSGA
jgi:hypothetical protein